MPQSTSHITVTEFLSLRDKGVRSNIIDVRTPAETQTEYLEGSEHLPLQDISLQSFNSLLEENKWDKQSSVYFLCGTGIRAKKAIELLASSTEYPLVIIKGGISELKNQGLALKQGESSVISLERQVRITAGLFVLTGVILGTFVQPAYYGISAFVGLGLIFAGLTDSCAMGTILAKSPWNTRGLKNQNIQ